MKCHGLARGYLHHAIDVPVDASLNWTGGDPDAGDFVTYNVSFGNSMTPPFVAAVGPYDAEQTSLSYMIDILSVNTTYYWQIVAVDSFGEIAEGPVWEFTTIEPIEQGPVIAGVIGEANCDTVQDVTVTLYKGGTFVTNTTSDEEGNYSLIAPETGTYDVVASKEGFKDEIQTVNVDDIELEYTVHMTGEMGLVPKAATMAYVLECVNHWLYPEPPCGLSMSKVLEVVNAWLYPT